MRMKFDADARRRKLTVIGFATAIFLSALVTPIVGQNAAAPIGNNAPAVTRIATPDDAADDKRYRIGAGDVLTINVRKAPELSGPVRVDQRGMIRIPMIDDEVKAACKTESELASEITNLYLEYKKSPNVDVYVTEFQSRPVAVIGAVNGAGQFKLQRQVRLLELLSFAAGPSGRAGRLVEVIHAGGPSLCQAGTGDGAPAQTESLSQQVSVYVLAKTLLAERDSNPLIQPGDIIHLPEADQVFIIGHVNQPQAISLRDKPISISRAIAMTGGPARDAKTSKIRIIRQTTDGDKKQEFFVNLGAIMKQQSPDILLMPNDIVEVPSSAGKTLLNTLQGAVAPALTQIPVRVIP
jgi:polysaccharide export outer membrane protein